MPVLMRRRCTGRGGRRLLLLLETRGQACKDADRARTTAADQLDVQRLVDDDARIRSLGRVEIQPPMSAARTGEGLRLGTDHGHTDAVADVVGGFERNTVDARAA